MDEETKQNITFTEKNDNNSESSLRNVIFLVMLISVILSGFFLLIFSVIDQSNTALGFLSFIFLSTLGLATLASKDASRMVLFLVLAAVSILLTIFSCIGFIFYDGSEMPYVIFSFLYLLILIRILRSSQKVYGIQIKMVAILLLLINIVSAVPAIASFLYALDKINSHGQSDPSGWGSLVYAFLVVTFITIIVNIITYTALRETAPLVSKLGKWSSVVLGISLIVCIILAQIAN